ncbi:choice-of-anchor L domain-containing protein [Flavobacterium sp. WC2509]|uniref:choice-of-anchor L domain-containing protein n=1 Tax=Flavobacterium sp. WC2509 TaxID=3461406 RepID=UPI004044379A
MMIRIKNILFLVIYFITTVATAQYININDTQTAQQLVDNVLINSSCASASSANAKGDTFTAGQNSYGSFNAGSSAFPFSEGVILSTFRSKSAIGPYIANQNGGGNSAWGGDADLDKALGIKSVNATMIEFDFVPLTNFISFNYIFASNEYQAYFPCEYSDGFAFLIKEKGSTDDYKNLAVLPGTNIPVSSKNVHPLINSFVDAQNITHQGCAAINQSYFNGFNTASSPVNYSGQTIKLNAQSDVVAGKTYHIKLVIADDKEEYFDSAIFLEGGSFKSKIDLGTDRTSTSNNPLCFGETLLIDTKLPASYSYKWYKDNIEISGETNPSLNVTAAGTYKVEVVLSPSVCTAQDEIKIEYAPQIILNNPTLYQCDDDSNGITIFDLTKMDNIIKNNNPKLTKLAYYTSLANAQGEINPILNPTSFQNTILNQTLYARVSYEFGCPEYAQLNLAVTNINNTISTQNPIESCDTDDLQDGITQIDLNAKVTPQVINGLPAGLMVEYYPTQIDAITQKNQLPNAFTNTIPNQQIIYARIVNGPDCYKIIPETLIINTFDPPNFEKTNAFLCDDSIKTLAVESGYNSYSWNNGDNANTINITKPGQYSVTVTNPKGCQKTKEFIIKPSGIATITDIKVTNFAGDENMISISYIGNGNYEFSIDGVNYQDTAVFNGLNAGIYWATARDKNGCGSTIPSKVYVLDYPRFFTPNNDGYNDTWKIKNLDILPKFNINIFDRYGKLLKQLNITNSDWNGRIDGKELPADDYWFTITFEDTKTIKGHFSLKR